MNYDELADQLKANSGTKHNSVFEPYLEVVVELLKRDVRKSDILKYIIENDTNGILKNKNISTLKSLFSKYANSKRILYLTKGANATEEHATKPQKDTDYAVGVPFKDSSDGFYYKYLKDGRKTRCTSSGISHNPNTDAAKDLY